MKPKPNLSATVDAWAKALGIQNRTLKIRLTKAGIKSPAGSLISAREMFRALTDDAGAERTQLVKAKRIAQEFLNRKADGELVELDVAERRVWQGILLPLKSELENLPSACAALANPEDPDRAHEVLSQQVEKILAQIRNAKN